ncbi:hypothetical protein HK102_014078 [Quaeritorhiza haematococci]|nr:hypothetical protein HK102_014078 [Quaeritorhiza haematococci]
MDTARFRATSRSLETPPSSVCTTPSPCFSTLESDFGPAEDTPLFQALANFNPATSTTTTPPPTVAGDLDLNALLDFVTGQPQPSISSVAASPASAAATNSAPSNVDSLVRLLAAPNGISDMDQTITLRISELVAIITTFGQLPSATSVLPELETPASNTGRIAPASSAPDLSAPAPVVVCHQERARRRPSKVYTCPHPQCGKTFTRNFNLKTHLKIHDPNREQNCGGKKKTTVAAKPIK